MEYEANTPKEYIDQLPDDWRLEKIKALRKIVKKVAPDLTEQIHYKMLAYGDRESYVFHLNAQKQYVSFYVGDVSVIDPDGELLKGINTGKGCIRFTKTVDIASSRIDEFVLRAVTLWRQGVDFGC